MPKTPNIPSPQKPPVAPNEDDMPQRIEGFNKELLPLLGKYELGLAASARFTPDGRVAADPVIISVRGRTDLQKPAPTPDAGLSKVE